MIDRHDGHSVDVTTARAVACGKRLVLEFTTDSGEIVSWFAQVVSCTPIDSEDGTQWRLTLSLAPLGLEPGPSS